MNTAPKTRSPEPTELLNLSEAANALGMSLSTIRRRVKRDRVAVYLGQDGRERLIHRRELDRWRTLRQTDYRATT